MTTNLLSDVEFADNPERRCPVVLVLDSSGSMAGEGIQQVNAGIRQLEADLRADTLAALRVELAIVTVGGTAGVMDVRGTGAQLTGRDGAQAFVTVENFTAPTLHAGGLTPMGGGVRLAIELLRGRKDIYKQAGIGYYRPWLMLLSDGNPTDTGWEQAASELVIEEQRGGLTVFPIGIENADLTILARFSGERPPLQLRNIKQFGEFFAWLSNSLSAVANSQPGDQVALPVPSGWATINP